MVYKELVEEPHAYWEVSSGSTLQSCTELRLVLFGRLKTTNNNRSEVESTQREETFTNDDHVYYTTFP